ncbi:MAG: FAD-dependent oxidoreductase [Chitinophagaceae bacterium]|nr:FAD-dependent oxidoreductase [Chitinophagaceae bacterium]
MLSFWEKDTLQEWDYIIVGSGIVGLNTAINIKEKHPLSKILILERGIFPLGASTKNAGFACFGSVTELLSDIKKMGEEKCLNLVIARWEGLQKLRSRVADNTMDFQQNGGYELITEKEIGCLHSLDYINQLLFPYFKTNVFTENKAFISHFGFSQKHIKTIIANPLEAQLHSGKMMYTLVSKATKMGISIFTGASVTDYTVQNNRVLLNITSQIQTLSLIAHKVAFCTNAFTKKIFKDIDIVPGRGIVLITKPIQNLKTKGTFHIDEGYFYFRNVEDRILLGGGRNMDFETETTTEFGINAFILKKLTQLLTEIIIPENTFEIEQVWSGIMAFGSEKEPIIKKIEENIVVGARLSGMGVAIGSLVAEKVSNLLLE